MFQITQSYQKYLKNPISAHSVTYSNKIDYIQTIFQSKIKMNEERNWSLLYQYPLIWNFSNIFFPTPFLILLGTSWCISKRNVEVVLKVLSWNFTMNQLASKICLLIHSGFTCYAQSWIQSYAHPEIVQILITENRLVGWNSRNLTCKTSSQTGRITYDGDKSSNSWTTARQQI